MSDAWKIYVDDPRTVCKYGKKCYQKKPEHHDRFKHPPLDAKRNIHRNHPYAREAKTTRTHAKPFLVDNDQTQNNNVKHVNASPEINMSSDDANKSTEQATTNIIIPDRISHHHIVDTDYKVFKEIFLVEMPTDFFRFYECLKRENSYEKTLSSVNLQLIGPFDLLAGKLPILEDTELYLVHWRFFYDPPEFQAVLKVLGNSEHHIGYFRDDPSEKPQFLASNNCAKDCCITPIASNIFAAVYFQLENEKSKSPFIALACQRLMDKVRKWATELEYPIQKFDAKKRLSKCVTKTFHGAGIMVPYNKKTELGYRSLIETDANLKTLFNKLSVASSQAEKDNIKSQIQPVITYANIAVDECDFGTGLEIGIDLFCTGLKEMEPSALSCLSSAYSLLERHAFVKIIQAHMKYRRRGPNMSILSGN